MGRTRIVFLAVALACMASLSVAQDEPKEIKEQATGEYELKSDKLSGKVSFFTQGDYVGAEFQINGPLQPDDKSAELNVLVSREDDAYQFVYNPTRAEVRRAVKTRVSNVWKDDPAGNDRHAGRVVSQTAGGWSAIVWIDAEAIGGSTQETWTLGAGVTVDYETASYPKSGDALPKVDLTELEERVTEEDHPAELALKAEKFALATLALSERSKSADTKHRLLLGALDNEHVDPALLVELVNAARESARDSGEWSIYEAALDTAAKAWPGWFDVHKYKLLILLNKADEELAANYFEKWNKSLPRTAARSWREFFRVGCWALAKAHRWQALRACLDTLTAEDFSPLGLDVLIKQCTEWLLGAGQDDYAIKLRDQLSANCTSELSRAELRVWWLRILAEVGRFESVLSAARALFGDEGVAKDESLVSDVAEDCRLAVGGAFDPPDAGMEIGKLIKEGEGFFGASELELLRKYAGVCEEADADWKAELAFRKEDAGKQNPRVRVRSDQGEFVIELFEDDAPNTVANFIKLAQDGFYESRKIYRREPGWLVQGGGRDDSPTGTGEDWSIKNEENRRQHWRGTIAMARTMDKESGNTHFFITIGNTPGSMELGTDWVVFGRIVEGLEHAQRLQIGDKITKATAENLRDHEYKPERIPVKKEPEQK